MDSKPSLKNNAKLPSALGWWLVCFSICGLTGCQGTEWGNTLQVAIAPQSPNAPSPTQIPALKRAVLPASFPKSVPVYAPAELDGVQANELWQSGAATWTTKDSSDLVLSFYRDALAKQEWNLLPQGDQPETNPAATPTASPVRKAIALRATKGNLALNVGIQPISAAPNPKTEIFLQYLPITSAEIGSVTPAVSPTPTPTQAVATPPPNNPAFSDLDTAPVTIRSYVRDLSQLKILTSTKGSLFLPNLPVSRRDYARWLFSTNNRIYRDRLPRQIRPASQGDRPTFRDVPPSDPDFGIIQGLANAGLISANPNAEFRPEATLAREEALIWKSPLDRLPLPTNATAAAVKQAWGFEDSDRLSPKGLQAALVDAQTGDMSNLRRTFGFTTLFQPQKPLTRGEAAAMLWYFGSQTEGTSALNILTQEQPSPEPTTTPAKTIAPAPKS